MFLEIPDPLAIGFIGEPAVGFVVDGVVDKADFAVDEQEVRTPLAALRDRVRPSCLIASGYLGRTRVAGVERPGLVASPRPPGFASAGQQ